LAYISEKIKAIHGDIEAADFVERHSSVIAPLAIVSNGTRRVTGSGADGLLSEDEKTELKGACSTFGTAWKAAYDRPSTPKGHIVVAHVPWFVDEYGICGVFGREAARRFTCCTRSAVRWYGRCAIPRPATMRKPCTSQRACLPRSLIGTDTTAKRRSAAILVLARERGMKTEVASNELARCWLDVLCLWITSVTIPN
jgi:hypothetical protein